MKENEYTKYQNMWDKAKAIVREEFTLTKKKGLK